MAAISSPGVGMFRRTFVFEELSSVMFYRQQSRISPFVPTVRVPYLRSTAMVGGAGKGVVIFTAVAL